MEPESLLLLTQESATGTTPDPAESGHALVPCYFKISFNTYILVLPSMSSSSNLSPTHVNIAQSDQHPYDVIDV
jgi:hypothetical protein